MLRLRDMLLDQRGEGPYPKALFTIEQHEPIRNHISEQLYRSWPAKVCVQAEVTIRRPTHLDQKDLEGGCLILWEALKFAGWVIDLHPKWLRTVYKPQVMGDEGKTVLELSIPESIEESDALRKQLTEA